MSIWKLKKAELWTLIENATLRLGLKRLTQEAFNTMWETDETVITSSLNGVMWINPEYMAYMLPLEDVKYIYVTRNHIRKERLSYTVASILRFSRKKLPDDVDREFRKAERTMKKDGRHYWVENCFLPATDPKE
ncbi:MAG: hypothetical protein K5663_10840 [Clostridiales bacterium]|nr:hypothetical protein [Clostridiales bacterium]